MHIGIRDTDANITVLTRLVGILIQQAGTSMATLHQVAGHLETYTNQENTKDVYSKYKH